MTVATKQEVRQRSRWDEERFAAEMQHRPEQARRVVGASRCCRCLLLQGAGGNWCIDGYLLPRPTCCSSEHDDLLAGDVAPHVTLHALKLQEAA